MTREAIFLIRTADRKGLLARITGFFYERQLNVLECRQYSDMIDNTYFMRVAVELDGAYTDETGQLRIWLPNGAYVFSVPQEDGDPVPYVANVKGGEWYAIAYDAKGASAKMNIFFRDAKHKYVQPKINLIYPDDGRGVVRVPEGGAKGTLVFSARNRPGETTVFDNIRVYRMPTEEDVSK